MGMVRGKEGEEEVSSVPRPPFERKRSASLQIFLSLHEEDTELTWGDISESL